MLLVLLLGIGICIVIMGCLLTICRDPGPRNDLQEPLVESTPADTTERTEASSPVGKAEGWVCSICEFENHSDGANATCVLCGTAQAFAFPLKSSTASSAPSLEVQAMGATTRQASFDRTRSFAVRCLNQLNTRQRGARNRQLWSRKRGDDGRWYWSKRDPVTMRSTSCASTIDDHNVKQVLNSPTSSQAVTIDMNELELQLSASSTDESVGSVSRPMMPLAKQESLAFVSQLTSSPRHPDGRVVFVDYRHVDANMASNGYVISDKDQRMLEQAAALPFQQKYAWFLRQTRDIIQSWKGGHMKMRVNRESVMEESLMQLLGIQMKDLHSPLRIEFLGEAAIDAGGVEREWFTLVTQKLFDDETGLFMSTDVDSLSYMINPRSGELVEDHLLYFRGAGRLIGRALLEGLFMQAHLALPMLKHLLGVPISFGDLEYVDEEVFRSLKWMKENDGVEALSLDFSVTNQLASGEMQTIDLKENGRNIEVNDDNKLEYIALRLRHIMLDSISVQLQHFMTGIFEVIPQELILVFDYQELELVLCGVPSIDLSDWQAHTRVKDDFPMDLKDWFWEIVSSFDDEQRVRLLQFSTGSSRVPVQGFKALTSYDGRLCWFTLNAVPYPENSYPCAHTCFNRIDLPVYPTKEELEVVLTQIINMEVTGFTAE